MTRVQWFMGVGAVALLAGTGLAQSEEIQTLPPMTMAYGSDNWVPAGTTRATAAYQNVNLASASFSRNFNTNTPGTVWLMGDDCQLLNLAGGSIVDELTFSAVNGTSTSALGGGTAFNLPAGAIRADIALWDILATDFNPNAPFFENNPTLGIVSVDLPALNSLQGGTFTVTGLSGLNINVGSGNVWMAIRFRDGPNAGDETAKAFRYGQIISNQAATVGFSNGGFFFRDQINGLNDALGLAFAAPTISNFNYGIATVPTPGSLALLGLGGLVAARRRRA